MAKTPVRQPRSVPPTKAVKRPRGRPPQPGGPKPQAEIQRAYRARLAAAGKVLKLVDADAIDDLAMLDHMRERLHDALLKLKLHEQDNAQLTARNHHLENELKRLEQHHTNALKEIVVLKQQAAASVPKRTRRKARP
jgi:cell division protein FtsB